MATFDVPTLEARLEAIRLLSSEEVQDPAVQVLPLDRLPLGYFHDHDRTTAYQASCLAWAVTSGTSRTTAPLLPSYSQQSGLSSALVQEVEKLKSRGVSFK